jgi:hypothetical protein
MSVYMRLAPGNLERLLDVVLRLGYLHIEGVVVARCIDAVNNILLQHIPKSWSRSSIVSHAVAMWI